MSGLQFRRLQFHALGGPCALQLYAADAALLEHAAEAARTETLRIEAKYSRYRPDSVLSAINATAGDARGVSVDAETATLLDYAAAAWLQSDGLFDISSGVLRRAWDFRSGRKPQPAELAVLLPLVGWQQLRWERPRVVLPRPGMELDFGGFGKEYAVDRVAALLLEMGVRHGLVEFGGDLRVLGPHPNGEPWRVGIRHPRQPECAVAQIGMRGGALATSGDYERYFEEGGVRYSHLLDPRTGWPVQGPASVSVAAPQCLLAGTLTTIAMLKGASGITWLQSAGMPWLAVDAGGDVYGSPEFQIGLIPPAAGT